MATVDSVRDEQPFSPLFKLLAELRNRVYELAFATDLDEDGTIKLTTAKPPSNALIRSCTAIEREALGLFSAALSSFFSETFTIDLDLEGLPSLSAFASAAPVFLGQADRVDIRSCQQTRLCRSDGIWTPAGGVSMRVVNCDRVFTTSQVSHSIEEFAKDRQWAHSSHGDGGAAIFIPDEAIADDIKQLQLTATSTQFTSLEIRLALLISREVCRQSQQGLSP